MSCDRCARQARVMSRRRQRREQAPSAVGAQVALLQMLSTSRLAFSRSVSISSEFMN
jgi:hypothetical protein